MSFPSMQHSTPPPLEQVVIRNINNESPSTSYEALDATEPTRQLPCFWRCICHHTCCRLRRRPTFPPTSKIRCRHHCHCRWWLPTTAYPMPPLIISSNISVSPPVSLCASPESPLKLDLGHSPSLCFIGKYEDSNAKYLKGELEEDLF